MIILDIETTGLSPIKNCMLSLGAVDYDSGARSERDAFKRLFEMQADTVQNSLSYADEHRP